MGRWSAELLKFGLKSIWSKLRGAVYGTVVLGSWSPLSKFCLDCKACSYQSGDVNTLSNLVAFASARGQALSGSKTCKTMQCSKPFLLGNRSRPYVPCPSGDNGPSCVDHFSPLVFWAGGQPLSSRHLEPKRAAGKMGQTLANNLNHLFGAVKR